LVLSVTAVYERIRKLEKEGYISGYMAILNKTKVDMDFMVFCHVKLVKHGQKFVVNFKREVKQIDDVLEC